MKKIKDSQKTMTILNKALKAVAFFKQQEGFEVQQTTKSRTHIFDNIIVTGQSLQCCHGYQQRIEPKQHTESHQYECK